MNEQYTKDYEKLREVIIGANDDIVELKFGCVIRWNDGSLPDSPITGVEPMSDGDWEVSWGCFNPDLSEPRYKILGRTIRLADILLAAGNKITGDYINDGGFLTFMKDDSDEPEEEWEWSLRNDSLDWHYHNKPETVKFLINLLVK